MGRESVRHASAVSLLVWSPWRLASCTAKSLSGRPSNRGDRTRHAFLERSAKLAGAAGPYGHLLAAGRSCELNFRRKPVIIHMGQVLLLAGSPSPGRVFILWTLELNPHIKPVIRNRIVGGVLSETRPREPTRKHAAYDSLEDQKKLI